MNKDSARATVVGADSINPLVNAALSQEVTQWATDDMRETSYR